MQGTNAEAVMSFMMPIIFTLFSNITDVSYKESFTKPCEFDSLLGLFADLPPYFNEIGKKYPDKPDLLAYYSMQLASSFLVNNGSLTMNCLYKMLDLQSRLGGLAIGILDHPEKHPDKVGLFGVFMKDKATELRSNPMLKIIEYVDKYEQNGNIQTVSLFSTFNVIFVMISLIGIGSNAFFLFIMCRAHVKSTSIRNTPPSTSNILSTHICMRYSNTRLAVCIIAIVHSLYLLINFIVMSQFKLAGMALGHLNESNFGCKLAFFLFPPTTAYNILYQYAVWLLVYVTRMHHIKLRRMKSINYYDLLQSDSSSTQHATIVRTLSNRGGKNKSKNNSSQSTSCLNTRRSVFWSCLIIVVLVIYNLPSIVFYSLNAVTIFMKDATGKGTKQNTVTYCAFDETFSSYYTLLNTKLMPALNIALFNLVPMVICFVYILLDVCFLVRMYKEQQKIYEKLKDFIEWPLYVYFCVFFVTHLPFIIHDLVDLVSGAIKFPFVFPLFIRMTFTSKVTLVIIEMLLISLAYSSYFYIWLATDRLFRQMVYLLFNKHFLCRSYNTHGGSSGSSTTSGTSQIIKTSQINVDPIDHVVERSVNVNGGPGGGGSGSTSTTSSTRSTSKIEAIESVASNARASSKLHTIQMIDTDNNDDDLNDLNYQSYPYTQQHPPLPPPPPQQQQQQQQQQQRQINETPELTYQNHIQLMLNTNNNNNKPNNISSININNNNNKNTPNQIAPIHQRHHQMYNDEHI